MNLAANAKRTNRRTLGNRFPRLLLVALLALAFVRPAYAAVSVTVSPGQIALNPGAQEQFSAQVSGTSNSVVIWNLSGPGCSGISCGQITGQGFYTAPTTIPIPNIVNVKATSLADTAQSGSATISINTLITVSVSPSTVQLLTGAQQQFSSTVTGSSDTAVTWSVSGAGCTGTSCGTITNAGLYKAPPAVPSPATVTVTATSQADPTKSSFGVVTVIAPVAVLISPTAANVATNSPLQFSATVTGTTNTAVTWSLAGAGCSGAACGTISSAGLYTAPGTIPSVTTVTVTATSQADTTKSASAVVTVVAPVAVSVSPSSASVVTGAHQQFAANVTGTSNTAVTWTLSGAGCSGAACGTISAGGLYTAPASIPSPATVTVTATSKADATKSGTAAVTVIAPIQVTVSPTAVNVVAGNQQQFTASVTGTANTAVTWTLSGAGCAGATCGTITSAGLYTAPTFIPSPATVAVTATSHADVTKSAKATVTIVASIAVSVSVSPTSANVVTGATQQFNATVTGSSNTAVTWTLSGAGCSGTACGTISSTGLYTAPGTIPNPATITVTATSQADATKSATATVTVVAAVAVKVSPTSASIVTGAQQQFTATVTGSSNTAVAWTVSGAGCSGATCGTITAAGLYTGPASVPSPATVSVTATSKADGTKSAKATVTVIPPVAVSVTPISASMIAGAKQQFTAIVTGTTNQAVTWTLAGAGCGGAACGTITTAGLYTAPAAIPSPATVTVTATSQADATKSATATVTVIPPVAVLVTPSIAKVVTGAQQKFTAKVTGTANTAVTWTLAGAGCSGTACGTITTAGVYTAPTTVPTPATVTVKATSQADTTKSASSTVTIVPPTVVNLVPGSAVLAVAEQLQFKARVSGPSNTAVKWSVSGAGCSGSACGTISSTGLYTAPTTVPAPAAVQVVATSASNGSKSASAAVTIVSSDNGKVAGPFALLFHGFDAAGIYEMAAGFVADGNGNLSGVEDVNRTSGPLTNQAITGSYSVGPDNRGTFTINNGSASSTFAFALAPGGKSARFIEFDSSGVRGSGILKAQNTSDFSRSALTGSYISSLNGADSAGGRIAALGLLRYNGISSIFGSTLDVNDNGNLLPTFTNFPGSYQIAANGRGSETLFIQGFDGQTFHMSFYVVSAQEIFVISSDPLSANNPIFSGETLQQSGTPFAGVGSLKGPTIFTETGLNNGLADVSVGRAVFDGSQTLTGQFVENNGGTVTTAGALSGDYSVELTGRTSLNLVNTQTLAQSTLVGYVVSPNFALVLDIGPAVKTGSFEPQLLAAPFNNSDVSGPFIFGSEAMAKQDAELAAGATLFDGKNAVDGIEDLSQSSGLTAGAQLSGTYSVSTSANNGSGTITLKSPAAQSLSFWMVSFSEFVGVDIDPANTSPTILRFEQ